MDNAFTWAKKNGGVCTESDYPYVSGTTSKSGTCTTSCSVDAKVAPKSFTDVKTNSDAALMSAIAQQPVSVAIEADQPGRTHRSNSFNILSCYLLSLPIV